MQLLTFNPIRSLEPKHIFVLLSNRLFGFGMQTYRATSSYKDGQNADKKIKDVRQQYHSKKN